MYGVITSEGRDFPPGTPRSCWCLFSPRCRTTGREAGPPEPGPSRCLASLKVDRNKETSEAERDTHPAEEIKG